MAAKVIKLANSSFYQHADRHVGIQQALRTIGLDMVKCIALSMAVMETFGNEICLMKGLWKHSHAVAFVSGLLGVSKPERECLFTGGLSTISAGWCCCPRSPMSTYPCAISAGTGLILPSRGISSAWTTAPRRAMVATRWHFPPEVIRIISSHHDPSDRLSALVGLTDQVIAQHERGFISEELEG